MAVIYNIEESLKNSAFNILQEPIKMILDSEMEAFEKDSIIDKFFVMKTSDKYREEYRSTTAMDGFKPTEDMEVAGLSDFSESYNKQFVFQTWTNSFVVSKQTIEDNQMMDIEPKAFGFIKSYGRTREQYAVRMISAALGNTYPDFKITASAGLGMDTTDGSIDGTKQQYFHNKHEGVKINGVSLTEQSNKFYSVVDLTEVGAEEKVLDILGQVVNKMKKFQDDKGNIVPVNATRIFIGEDYRLQDILERGLKSKYGSPMSGNGINTKYGKFEVVVSPYLSEVEGFQDGEYGMIIQSPERNREGLGAVWFDRKPLEVRSYIDDKTEANVWAGRARWGAGFGDFRAMSYVQFVDDASDAPSYADVLTPIAVYTNVNVVNPTTNPVNTKEVV